MPVIVNDKGFAPVKVPQIQFIASLCGHSCCATQTGATLPAFPFMASMNGFFSMIFRIFGALQGYPGVDRQFSEPSMAKSSLPSRAPAQ